MMSSSQNNRMSPRVTRSTANQNNVKVEVKSPEMSKESNSSGSELNTSHEDIDEKKAFENLTHSMYLAQVNSAGGDRNQPSTEHRSLAEHKSSSYQQHFYTPEGVATPRQHLPTKRHQTPPLQHQQKPSTQYQSSTKSSTSCLSNIIVYIIVGVLAICGGLGLWSLRASSSSNFGGSPAQKPPIDVFDIVKFEESFDERLSQLKTIFSHQNARTWRTMRAAVLAVARNPTTPAVIAAVGTERALRTANCLAVTLADAVRRAYNDSGYVRVDCARFRSRTDDWAGVKLELDGHIRAGLGATRSPQHVVLVERLDLLPAKSGLLFHGLCDNENAPFKQAVYIFTSRLGDDEMSGTGASTNVDLVDVQVTAAWEGVLDEDQRGSLESRIGNHNVGVVSESADALASAACR